MPHRKSRLKLHHQDLAVNADVRTKKLSPENLEEKPEIIRRDEKTGTLVVRQVYDKATDEPLEEGYGYRWVNEEGDEVPTEDIQEYVVKDDEERPISKYDPTLGGDRTLEAIQWIPVATIDEYLIDKTYEMWGEDDTDVQQLLELAEHIRDFDEAPVVPIVIQPSYYKQWGILTPIFFEDEFSLIVRITSQKILPDERMPILSDEEVQAAKRRQETEAESEHLEQQSPFE